MHQKNRQMLVAFLPVVLACIALILGVADGLRWFTSASKLTSLVPDGSSFKIGMSSMIAAIACAILFSQRQARYTRLAIICGLYAIFMSVTYLLFEQFITSIPIFVRPPAVMTCIVLLLLSVSSLLLLTEKRSVRLIVGLLIFSILLSLFRLIIYIFGFGDVRVSGIFESMSIPTALCVLILGVGLFLHKRLPFAAQLAADTLQGRLLRAALPWTILTPNIVAILFASTIGGGIDSAVTILVGVIASLTIIMTFLLWNLSNRLEQADQQRLAAERTLLLSEKQSWQIIEHSPIAKLVLDEAGYIEHVNLSLEQMLGYNREELLGQPLEILIPERFRFSHGAFMYGYISSPKVRNMGEGRDLFARHKDGSEVAVEIALAPLKTTSGTLILANIVDISARWKYQADMQAALHEKTVLLNEIHHRVKNNLQIVASLLSLQANRVSEPQFASLIAESEGRVRAMALMHQVLYERTDFSRVQLDVYLQRLCDLISQIYDASRNYILIHVQAEPTALGLSQAIPLGLVVNELLSNVFKHAFPDRRGGEVWVELQAWQEQARLTVRDNGCGLSDGFASNHASSLGLQIVYLLVEQIGSTLSVRNEGGACFELLFTPAPDGGESDTTTAQEN